MRLSPITFAFALLCGACVYGLCLAQDLRRIDAQEVRPLEPIPCAAEHSPEPPVAEARLCESNCPCIELNRPCNNPGCSCVQKAAKPQPKPNDGGLIPEIKLPPEIAAAAKQLEATAKTAGGLVEDVRQGSLQASFDAGLQTGTARTVIVALVLTVSVLGMQFVALMVLCASAFRRRPVV